MATVQRRIVHKQFNSPIGMYSDTNIKETLDRDLKILSNGAVGIEFETNNPKLGNLANSAVLRMLEEEEATKAKGLKKVAWPPRSDSSPCRNVAQPQQQQHQQQPAQYQQPPQQQQQQQSHLQQQHQHQQPQGDGNYQNTPLTQNTNSYQQQQHQQQARQYQQQQYQNNSTRYSQSQSRSTERPAQTYTQPQAQPSYINRQTNTLPINRPGFLKGSSPSTTAFSGGLSVSPKSVSNNSQYSTSPCTVGITSNKALSPQPQVNLQPTPQYSSPISSGPLSPPERVIAPGSPRGWAHVDTSIPVHTGYTRQFSNQQNIQSSFKEDTSSYSVPTYAEDQNQYQPQATQAFRPVNYNQEIPQYTQQQHHQPQQQEQHYQEPQQQYQPSQQQPYYRQESPGYITLRNEAPVSQKSAPVYSSQPAAASYGGGSSMRGDEKWPPATVKAQSEFENEARRRLAQGPTCRPRRANKDYSQFFAQHTLNSTYPGYRAPPGTQHHGTSFQ